MSKYFTYRLGGLVPYTPGEQPKDMQYIKLNTNESPFPPSKSVSEAVISESQKLQLYSDPESINIRTKLSDDITKILSTKPTYLIKIVSEIRNFICNNILSKISKSFNRNQDVKIALSKLTTLNKNVDELITMQTPYGEADEWYDKLSDYLNTANVIHFQISKTVGTPTFFDTISSLDKQKIGAKRKNSSNFNNMANKPK